MYKITQEEMQIIVGALVSLPFKDAINSINILNQLPNIEENDKKSTPQEKESIIQKPA